MLINANTLEKQYDIIIIGSGPAGITLALELEKGHHNSILLIESGFSKHNTNASRLSRVTATGDLSANYYPNHAQRILGGTSSVWGGWCGKLEKRAFLTKEWPIEYEEIDPYYEPAAEILNLPEEAYKTPETPIQGSDKLVYKPYYTAKRLVRFSKKFKSNLQKSNNISLLLGYTCTDLTKELDGRVSAVSIRQTDTTTVKATQISCNKVILACGGIGNAAILNHTGLSNSPLLGKGFSEHPHLYSVARTQLNTEKIKPSINTKNPVYHGIQLGSEYCSQNNLLSMTFDFNSRSREQDIFHGKTTRSYQTDSTIRAEMPLTDSNQVTAGKKRNQFDQLIPHINLKFNSYELIHPSWEIFREEFTRTGLGRIGALKKIPSTTGGGHYLCSTRMGKTQEDSVVDKNCKVHGTTNTYIAGSSIFSAGGAINPTYSIVAFAIRLAKHLSSNKEQ